LVVRFAQFGTFSDQEISLPPPSLVPTSQVVVSGWMTNFWGYGLYTLYRTDIRGNSYPSLSSELAGVAGDEQAELRPDYSIDPNTVRTISASQLIAGHVPPGSLKDRKVIVTEPRTGSASRVGYFGHSLIDPVYLDIAGSAKAKYRPSW
ncbi:hypothetical protein ACNJUL_20910, partial [Mycobacterium tuberculosis]